MNPKALMSLGLLLSIVASFAQAQEATVSDFAWMDRNHMAQQVESIENITRIKFGTPIRENKSDLETLQRIIDQDLIDRDETLKLQALGAVLGNVMASEVEELEWKVYEDQLGRSRALCIKGTRQCLFPITMLSRRMEVGLKPNVERIYNEAMELVDPHLPKAPYGAP